MERVIDIEAGQLWHCDHSGPGYRFIMPLEMLDSEGGFDVKWLCWTQLFDGTSHILDIGIYPPVFTVHWTLLSDLA